MLLAAVAWGVQRFVGWDTVATTATQIPSADWLAFTAFLLLSYLARRRTSTIPFSLIGPNPPHDYCWLPVEKQR